MNPDVTRLLIQENMDGFIFLTILMLVAFAIVVLYLISFRRRRRYRNRIEQQEEVPNEFPLSER